MRRSMGLPSSVTRSEALRYDQPILRRVAMSAVVGPEETAHQEALA